MLMFSLNTRIWVGGRWPETPATVVVQHTIKCWLANYKAANLPTRTHARSLNPSLSARDMICFLSLRRLIKVFEDQT